jgi:hypothetical protein
VHEMFLFCRECAVLHPIGALHADDDDAALDLAEFRSGHEAHGLEQARCVPDSAVYDAPAWDPMATRWFRVAVGSELLQVRSWRASIEEPRRHEIATAPAISAERVEIDARLLRHALDRHFYPHALRPAKVERFIDTICALLATVDPAATATTFDDPSVPNASIGPFPARLCDTLLNRCSPIFDAWELERVASFIENHRFEDGALAIRVRRVLARSAA